MNLMRVHFKKFHYSLDVLYKNFKYFDFFTVILLFKSLDILFCSLPKETLSAVASLLSQKETHDKTTSRTQGPYTCIKKFPMCLCRWKLTSSMEYCAEKSKIIEFWTYKGRKAYRLRYQRQI